MEIRDIQYKLREDELRRLSYFLGTTEPVIVGLNTFQGINVSSIFSKGILEQTADKLSLGIFKPKVIDGCTLMYNKTEHALEFLKSDLSVEEIKALKKAGGIASVKKAMGEMGPLKYFKGLAGAYGLTVRTKPEDRELRIASAIKDAKRPIVIVSTGQNDLMREVQANPFAIRKDYRRRETNPSFDMSSELVKRANVSKIVDKIEKIQNKILYINPSAIVVILSSYKPKSLEGKTPEEKEAFSPFGSMIDTYNDRLQSSAQRKKSLFVSTDVFGEKEMGVIAGLRANLSGNSLLSDKILWTIYHEVVREQEQEPAIETRHHDAITGNGLDYFENRLNKDLADCQKKLDEVNAKPNAAPHTRKVAEVKVFESQMAVDACKEAAKSLELRRERKSRKEKRDL